MFFDSLDNIRQGLCVCVFDGTDRVQHTFWRQMDETHPAHGGNFIAPDRLAVEEIYTRADTLLGKTMEKCNDKDTLLMVISDHGFKVFRYGVDLNRWLEENGYLKLKDGNRDKKNLVNVDWSHTRAFAIGLSGLYLNLKGREAKGIVDPKTEAPQLREEIAEKLRNLRDSVRNQPAVKQVYNAWKIYQGPYKNDAPDLLVGYQVGYRASWETAVGQVTDQVFHDNKKAWSGDHCIDQSLVPGVLFCNRGISDEHPRLMDIGPTVLDMFGVKVPANMDGRPLAVAGEDRDASEVQPSDT
jgi:predicted AlkP superfamily phosphohydrolase/phosphomutase